MAPAGAGPELSPGAARAAALRRRAARRPGRQRKDLRRARRGRGAQSRARPTACLVPATLARAVASDRRAPSAWKSSPARTRRSAAAGCRPSVGAWCVVDEAHHFRNPATWRYRHVAPWLVGRPVLLVTATPVVNRLDDLLHQLLLGVRDDALAADGVASLKALLGHGRGSPALGRLVVESPCPDGLRPERTERLDRAGPAEMRGRGVGTRVHRPAAALAVAGHRGAGPSGAAARGGVQPRRAGRGAPAIPASPAPCARRRRRRPPARARGDPPLHRRVGGPAGLVGADARKRRPERSPARRPRPDRRSTAPGRRRRGACPTGRSSGSALAARRRTAHAGLHFPPGNGALPPRPARPPSARLVHRRPRRARAIAPCHGRPCSAGSARGTTGGHLGVRHLLVTDVAAEGLDLQRAARVIHYDLPWTPMRMEQREGRAVRLGSIHREVEVVVFRPPAAHRASTADHPRPGGQGQAARRRRSRRGGSRTLALALGAGRCVRRGRSGIRHGGGAAWPAGVLAGFELYRERRHRADQARVVVGLDRAWTASGPRRSQPSLPGWPMRPPRASREPDPARLREAHVADRGPDPNPPRARPRQPMDGAGGGPGGPAGVTEAAPSHSRGGSPAGFRCARRIGARRWRSSRGVIPPGSRWSWSGWPTSRTASLPDACFAFRQHGVGGMRSRRAWAECCSSYRRDQSPGRRPSTARPCPPAVRRRGTRSAGRRAAGGLRPARPRPRGPAGPPDARPASPR